MEGAMIGHSAEKLEAKPVGLSPTLRYFLLVLKLVHAAFVPLFLEFSIRHQRVSLFSVRESRRPEVRCLDLIEV